MEKEQEASEGKDKTRRRFLIGTAIGGSALVGAGVGTAATPTGIVDWVFEVFGVQQDANAPVKPTSISTEPPGRAVKGATIEFTEQNSEQTTVSILVAIDGETGEGTGTITVTPVDGTQASPDPIQANGDGWPYFEYEFDADEVVAFEYDFGKTYGNVQDDDLQITVEKVVS